MLKSPEKEETLDGGSRLHSKEKESSQISKQRMMRNNARHGELCSKELKEVCFQFYAYLKKMAVCSFITTVESNLPKEGLLRSIIYVSRDGKMMHEISFDKESQPEQHQESIKPKLYMTKQKSAQSKVSLNKK